MLLMSGLLLTPLIYLLFDRTEIQSAPAFAFAAIVSFAVYLVFGRILGKRGSNAMTHEEAALSVSLTWIVVCIVSAIPFMILNRLSFSHAYFEAMSGYTTTGLTLFNYELGSNIMFLWRSIMQYVGGAGIAVLLISLANAPYGSGLSSAEGKADLLVPQIQRSARLVMIIYGTYALVGIIALKIAGMTWFDSVNHAFAALSTGGFSTHTESISWFNSKPIEAIIMVMMFLGNLNFLNAYILFGGRLKTFLRNGEIKVQLILIPAVSILLTALVTVKLYGSFPHSLRVALFETVSALTTTGLTIGNYGRWSQFGLFVITILMLIGGGSNSTAGGIKQYRLYFIYKSIIQSLKELTSPLGRIVRLPYWWGDKKMYITGSLIQSLFMFILMYLGIYIIGVGIMTAYGISLKDAVFEFASTLSNSGLSLGITNVSLPLPVIWTQTVAMFLGRLEILIIMVAMAKIFRDGKRIII